ncbi:MAG: hypothetical protein JNK23_22055 [Opitutaceae bacterium]|nr:hypothetical protein [Opitutaceae bacterium]
MPPRIPFTLLLALLVLPAGPAIAAEQPASSAGERVRERMLRMTEFLDTMLPGVLEQNNVTLHFRPKFSDLRDHEFLRLPFELRYGLTDRWELRGGLSPFTPNPFNTGREHRWGPGEVKLAALRDLECPFGFYDETTLVLETRIPLGTPPAAISDHYTHLKPSFTAARRLRTWPSTTLYTNLAYDRSIDLTHRDPSPAGVERRDVLEAAPGLLFKPGELGWFAEYRLRHIFNDEGNHLGHKFQAGTIWDVPLARTEKWKLPGKWQVELAYRVELEEGRERDHGISARVNWRTTLREVLQHGRAKTVK